MAIQVQVPLSGHVQRWERGEDAWPRASAETRDEAEKQRKEAKAYTAYKGWAHAWHHEITQKPKNGYQLVTAKIVYTQTKSTRQGHAAS